MALRYCANPFPNFYSWGSKRSEIWLRFSILVGNLKNLWERPSLAYVSPNLMQFGLFNSEKWAGKICCTINKSATHCRILLKFGMLVHCGSCQIQHRARHHIRIFLAFSQTFFCYSRERLSKWAALNGNAALVATCSSLFLQDVSRMRRNYANYARLNSILNELWTVTAVEYGHKNNGAKHRMRFCYLAQTRTVYH